MDRRQFLAAGGLAAASPVLAQAVEQGAGQMQAAGLFKTVNFQWDGLGLDPREYTSLLNEELASRPLEPDYYSNGGLIAELEQRFAKRLGKEAAMFVPTGTLANHLAIRKLAGSDRRVLVQAESHLYNDSGDGAAALSGLNLIPLATGRATVELPEVQSWVERTAGGRVEAQVGVISIESPVRRRDHEYADFAELERISRYARERGIRLHLDGARLFNLPLHTAKSLQEYAALFDTVYVSLWKHFNGATGAILAGSTNFIQGLFHTRRMFGGSLPLAWPSVALVPRFLDSYQEDYARSWQAADQIIALLGKSGRLKAEKLARGTSRFLLHVSGATPEQMAGRALKFGVVLPHPKAGTSILPMQVNPTLLRMSPAHVAQVLNDAAGA